MLTTVALVLILQGVAAETEQRLRLDPPVRLGQMTVLIQILERRPRKRLQGQGLDQGLVEEVVFLAWTRQEAGRQRVLHPARGNQQVILGMPQLVLRMVRTGPPWCSCCLDWQGTRL